MQFKDVTTWTVTPDHKARPKNPFVENSYEEIYGPYNDNTDVLCYQDWAIEQEENMAGFEKFATQHTYHCSPSLVAGEYPAGDVELVWQYRNANFNDTHHTGKYWLNMLTGAFDTIQQTVEYYESDGYNTRQYLQLKQPVKEQEIRAGDLVRIKDETLFSVPSESLFKVIHISRKEPKIGICTSKSSTVIYLNTSLITY